MKNLILQGIEKTNYGYEYWFEAIDYPNENKVVAEKVFGPQGKEERLFLRKIKGYPLYDYGLEQLYSDHEHDKGYVWSSRCGVINKYFGTSLVEVIVGCVRYAMDVNDLLKYLPKGCKFVKIDQFDGDVSYALEKGA